MLDLSRDGDVFVLRMDHDENRFSPDMLHELDDAFATVETTEGPRALVTTGTGKFFTNGLDLDWLNANSSEAGPYIDRVQRLLARVLHLPCTTVAACNGHAFGAGAMLAICHDHRIMRADRGYWCLPEVNLGMPFPRGMNALVSGILPTRAAHEAMVTGRRFTAADALEVGIVDAVRDEASVLDDAIAWAGAHAAKAGPNIAGIRTTLHAGVIAELSGGPG